MKNTCFLATGIFHLCIIAVAGNVINIGSVLRDPKETWSSPNFNFSFGFIPSFSDPNLYLVGIFFSTRPVWTSGAEPVDSGASLSLLSDGNLCLFNGSGTRVWDSGTANMGVSSAILEDSGNFVLRNGSGSIWETFEHPTDTILQGQNFTLAEGLKFPVLTLQSDGILVLNDPSLDQPYRIAYSNDYTEVIDVFRLVKLDPDGNLRIYSFKDSSLTVRWVALQDQCRIYGYCGDMGICTYYSGSKPICICPSLNFELIDPNDSRKHCKTKVELFNCLNGTTTFQLNNSEFVNSPLELRPDQYTILGFRQCQASPTILSTVFVKVCSPYLPNPPLLSPQMNGSRSPNTKLMVGLVVSSLFTIVVLQAFLSWFVLQKGAQLRRQSTKYSFEEYASDAPVQFSFKEVRSATRNFRERIGVGGFGVVYKGVLPNNTVVAVKRLEGIEQGEKQFKMEVGTIGNTHHLNLVRLMGFCSEGQHRLLVYEFMRNGSLDNFLFMDGEGSINLHWEARFNIALGTARALTYLHEECQNCIIHCDIKPENILLDENYVPKVSDFWLAELMNSKFHRLQSLNVRGTRGYLAPEWRANRPTTSEAYVYSYGMVLLEIISGRRNFDVSEETENKTFMLWAYEEFHMGRTENIVDRMLGGEVNMEEVSRAIQVSFWCVQEQPSKRPSMGKVVHMLEGIVATGKPPPPKK
ncbi:hypothetical protein AMTRI_Chr11g98540 [Amborella trichopoda]